VPVLALRDKVIRVVLLLLVRPAAVVVAQVQLVLPGLAAQAVQALAPILHFCNLTVLVLTYPAQDGLVVVVAVAGVRDMAPAKVVLEALVAVVQVVSPLPVPTELRTAAAARVQVVILLILTVVQAAVAFWLLAQAQHLDNQ
jgi:hypothetical protein